MWRWTAITIVTLSSLGLGSGLGMLIDQLPVGLGLGALMAIGLAAAIGFPMNRPWGYREGGEGPDANSQQNWTGGD